MAWLAGKVSGLVKDAQRMSAPSQYTADDLAAELTQQARAITSMENALDLISRWNEQINSNSARFPLRTDDADNHLSFHLVLLRSQAFETLLDACARAPVLFAAVHAPDFKRHPLGQALFHLAESVLLPGSMNLWPTLLEGMLVNDDVTKAGGWKWRPWARHVLTSMKRRWESEALTAATKQLDRQLGKLAAAAFQCEQDSSASEELQRQGAVGTLSKRGIRAAFARSQMRKCVVESDSWRRRTELLSEICERLQAIEGCTDASVPNLERLLSDAENAIGTLDSGEVKLDADQETLGKDLSDLAGALQKQITGVLLMQESFIKKRTSLCEEREALMRQVSELDSQLELLDEEMSRCKGQVMQLRGQFESMTKHYDSTKSGILSVQRGVTDRKIQAFSFKAMSEQALSVARADAKRHDFEVRNELRRRRIELRRTCAAYINSARLRFQNAKESLDDSRVVRPAGENDKNDENGAFVSIGEELAELMSSIQGAWRTAQAVLKRVEPLVDASGGVEGDGISVASATPEKKSSEQAVEEDVREFFSSDDVIHQGCVDCGTPLADWASVSYGIYLCLDCAGRHRGLGVHLSFVRSTKMDRWSIEQLQRMKLGGNARFHEFLKGFPGLAASITSPSSHRMRYSSRAAAFYRKRLDAECSGKPCSVSTPPAEEGHLPAEKDVAPGGDGYEEPSPSRLTRGKSDSSYGDDVSGSGASLEEERAALEAMYLELQCRLRDALMPK